MMAFFMSTENTDTPIRKDFIRNTIREDLGLWQTSIDYGAFSTRT